ncbi:MAG TPA: hypothetical protein VK712_02230, partial [Verrucomicrobiae bacterium]|nr:hypothetical protein [Verrucomicrobiae bacterium]
MSNQPATHERLAPYYQAAREYTVHCQELETLEQLVEQMHDQSEASVGLVEAIAGNHGVAVIAEHKRRSPSEGEIRPGSSVQWTVEQYQRGGAR